MQNIWNSFIFNKTMLEADKIVKYNIKNLQACVSSVVLTKKVDIMLNINDISFII